MQVNGRNARGQTALHLAATAGNADVVKVLLDHGASRGIEDAEDCTALHAAAQCTDDSTGALVVRALCTDAPSRGTRDNLNNEQHSDNDDDDDDDDFVNRKNCDGKTALHLATAAGKLRMVQVPHHVQPFFFVVLCMCCNIVHSA